MYKLLNIFIKRYICDKYIGNNKCVGQRCNNCEGFAKLGTKINFLIWIELRKHKEY